MKRLMTIVFMLVLASQFLTGCSESKHIKLKDLYHQVVGFSDNDETLQPVPQDAILLMTHEDYQSFMDMYFSARELPIESPDKDKAVLYLQFPSASTAVDTFCVKNIYLKNKTMTVNIKNIGTSMVDPIAGFDGTFKWVMFLEFDKSDLKDNMKIVINK